MGRTPRVVDGVWRTGLTPVMPGAPLAAVQNLQINLRLLPAEWSLLSGRTDLVKRLSPEPFENLSNPHVQSGLDKLNRECVSRTRMLLPVRGVLLADLKEPLRHEPH